MNGTKTCCRLPKWSNAFLFRNTIFHLLAQQQTCIIWRLDTLRTTLGKSSHLKVHLKRRVILLHFGDVNIFIDVTPRWPPSVLLLTFLFSTLGGISYFPIKKNPFTLFLCVLSAKGFIWCVFCFYPICSLGVFLQSLYLIVSSFLKSISSLV